MTREMSKEWMDERRQAKLAREGRTSMDRLASAERCEKSRRAAKNARRRELRRIADEAEVLARYNSATDSFEATT